MKSSKRLGRTGIALDIFEGGSSIKENECFVDLGLFTEDQRICDPTWIDIYVELYELDDNGKKAIIHNLTINFFGLNLNFFHLYLRF